MLQPFREHDESEQQWQQQQQQQQQQPLLFGGGNQGTSSSIVASLPGEEREQPRTAVSDFEERLESCENLIRRSSDKLTGELEGLRAGLAGDAAGLPEARAVVLAVRDLIGSRDEHAKEIKKLQRTVQSLTGIVDQMHHALQQRPESGPVLASNNPLLPPPFAAPLATTAEEATMEPAKRAELEALRAEFQERHLNLLADIERSVNDALAQLHDRLVACEHEVAGFSATEQRQEPWQLHLEEKHAELKTLMKEELLFTHKKSVNEVLEMAQARDGELVEAFARAKQTYEQTALKVDRTAETLRAYEAGAGGGLNETCFTALVEERCAPLVDRADKLERRLDAASSEHFAQLDALRQLELQQQQERHAPLEFNESTRALDPTVSSAGGGLSETRFTALFEEHCAPLVELTDKLERRLNASSSEQLTEVDAMRADHESLYHGMHHAKVEGLERAVHELGKKSEFHDCAYDDLGQRLAATGQPHTTSAHLEGLLAGLENLAEKTQRQANDLMACKMKVASCDDHCALLDDHCVDQMEHANNATQKHDRLLGELMEHRERACLQEQGVQQELQRLKADLHSRDGFSGVDVAGVEARFEKRLEGLASNVSSQMKLSRDETDQVRLLLAGVQKAWGVTIRNPRQSRKSRHPYG